MALPAWRASIAPAAAGQYCIWTMSVVESRAARAAHEENENHIPCIRCLLQELDPAQYEQDIGRLLRMMDADVRTAEPEYQRRLAVCQDCEYLSCGTCNACGCYVELRAATQRSHCPYRKW